MARNLKPYSIKLNSQPGFSLMEIVVVMGMLAMIAAMTAVVNIDTYRGYLFRSERNLTVTVLYKARSQSVSNLCMGIFCTDGRAHGVHFKLDADNNLLGYVIFQCPAGPTPCIYISRDAYDIAVDESVQTSGNVQFSGPEEIIFGQLSGQAVSNPAETWGITLSNATGHYGAISVNSEGQVDWNNISIID